MPVLVAVLLVLALGAANLLSSVLGTSGANAGDGPPGQQPPTNIEPPIIKGALIAGEQLATTAGLWGGPAVTTSIEWQRCSTAEICVPIDGARSTTYVSTAADVSSRLKVVVRAENKNGETTAASVPTDIVAPAPLAPQPSDSTSSSSSTPTPTPTPTPTATASTCGSGKWTGEYFANVSLAAPVAVSRCDDAVNFSWGSGAPAAGVPADSFSVRWTGVFSFPEGSTTFTVTADDGVRLWVDGTLVIDKWVDQYNATYSVSRTLTAGSHQIKVEYYERTGGATARLGWSAGGSSTTPTPTTSTGGATGSITFTGDWETGDVSQWTWGAQCSNVGDSNTLNQPNRGTLNITTSPVSQGSKAAKIVLPAYSGGNACEVLRKRTLNLGSDDYYGMEYFFPADWQEPSSAGWGAAIAQFNYQLIWGTPVGLFAHGDHVRLVMQSGYCNDYQSSRPGCAYSSGIGGNVPETDIVPRGMLVKGRWIQMIVRVRWAKDSSGILEGWYRYKGDANWTKTVTQTGYPTVQWSSSQSAPSDQVTSDKFGAYRGGASFPLSIWNDNIHVGTSFSATASTFS